MELIMFVVGALIGIGGTWHVVSKWAEREIAKAIVTATLTAERDVLDRIMAEVSAVVGDAHTGTHRQPHAGDDGVSWTEAHAGDDGVSWTEARTGDDGITVIDETHLWFGADRARKNGKVQIVTDETEAHRLTWIGQPYEYRRHDATSDDGVSWTESRYQGGEPATEAASVAHSPSAE